MFKLVTFFFCILCLYFEECSANTKVLIIIRGQINAYHKSKAENLQTNIYQQIAEIKTENVHVTQITTEWPVEEAWVILPIIPDLTRKYASRYDWVMFVEEWTNVDIAKLQKFITEYDSKQPLLLGHGLKDSEPVIIHHFDFDQDNPLLFPDFDAGWIISSELLKMMTKILNEEERKADFQIDVKHELVKWLKTNLDFQMTHADVFCNAGETQATNPECMSWVEQNYNEKCNNGVTINDVFFAIKTTKMFHGDRVKVVEQTWGALPIKKLYYSNTTDPDNDKIIDCGVPNTVRGHCGKSSSILKDFVENRDEPWLIIADDDTILSVARMLKLLNCYNHKTPVFIGERYGFGLNRQHGYSYITGGGGMVFSRPAAEVWVNDCECPSIETPDDMFISQCIWYRKGVTCTHSPAFHQGRPADYSEKYIQNHEPVSFHKHWNNDPHEVYNTYFAGEDNKMLAELYATGVISPPPKATQAPIIEPQPLPPTPLQEEHDEL